MPSLPLVAAVGLVVVLPAALLTLKLLVLDPCPSQVHPVPSPINPPADPTDRPIHPPLRLHLPTADLGPKLEAIALELHPQTLRQRVRSRQRKRRSAAGSGTGTDEEEENELGTVPLLPAEVGVLIDAGGGPDDRSSPGADDGLRRRRSQRSYSPAPTPPPTLWASLGRVPTLLSSTTDRRLTERASQATASDGPRPALVADENAGRRDSPVLSPPSPPAARSAQDWPPNIFGQLAVLSPRPTVKGEPDGERQTERSSSSEGQGTFAVEQQPLVDLSSPSVSPAQSAVRHPTPVTAPSSTLASTLASSLGSPTPAGASPFFPADELDSDDALGESWAVFAPAELSAAPAAAEADEGGRSSPSPPSTPLTELVWPPSALATPVAVGSFASAFAPSPLAPFSPAALEPSPTSFDSNRGSPSDRSTSPSSRSSSPSPSASTTSSTAASAIFVDRPSLVQDGGAAASLATAATAAAASDVGSGGWTPTDGSEPADDDEQEDDGWSELGSVA